LHYFNDQITKQIFTEIYRVLKKGGILAFFTNSINDPEYSTGEKIEDNFFVIDGVNKRYLSKTSAGVYAKGFHEILLDEDGETYKDMAVGVHNLVRYVGKK
jgi:ubiquinone/menaquinone biosynthesis C-methylase UbiE